MIGDKSYLSNKTTFSFDESNSLSFKTNRNLDKDISEYYTLIYEYKNILSLNNNHYRYYFV